MQDLNDHKTNHAYTPKVTVIPQNPSYNNIKSQSLHQGKKLKVAAYCRVSTEGECQQTSYHLQVEHYKDLIIKNPNWSLYHVFADEGITGTSLRNRDQFSQMIADALDGKLNYIITKSISRFARNTVDTLNCVRQLCNLNPPVGVYFEKENIDTLDVKGELILTILSALAQDESRSISDNIRWAIQKKMEKGDPTVNLNRMIGYEQGPLKEWLINEEQAVTVRYIYNQFLDGSSATKIASDLIQMGAITGHGKVNWTANSVLRILRNEKFTGDLMLQKTVTESFLTHKSILNTGQMPSYYVRDHHPAIIERTLWNDVQEELKNRKKNALLKQECPGKNNSTTNPRVYPFSKILYCGRCGQKLIRRSLRIACGESHYYKCSIWKCRNADGRDSLKTCQAPYIPEFILEQCFMEELYHMLNDYMANGKFSYIEMEFQKNCYVERSQRIGSDFETQRLTILKSQISTLEQQLNYKLDEEIFSQLKLDLDKKLKEYNTLHQQQTPQWMQPSYDSFIDLLKRLPLKNTTGLDLNIWGLNTKKQSQKNTVPLESANDILPFDNNIFQNIVTKGYVLDANEVIFETTFNVRIHINICGRKIEDFIGYRKADESGHMELITDKWDIVGGRPGYR